MVEESLSKSEKDNLMKEVDYDKLNPQVNKDLISIDKKIKKLLQLKKISEQSKDVLFSILSAVRCNLVLNCLPKEQRENIVPQTNGFKSNADFNYHRWLNLIESEITEKEIKKDLANLVKNLRDVLYSFEKELPKKPAQKIRYGCKLICPYCEEEYIKEFGESQPYEFQETCPSCSKEYKVLSGKVVLWKGRGTGVAGYGNPQYTVRIKNDDGEKILYFETKYNLLHIKTGDGVYFAFKKKFWSQDFSEKPFSVLNATSNNYSLI